MLHDILKLAGAQYATSFFLGVAHHFPVGTDHNRRGAQLRSEFSDQIIGRLPAGGEEDPNTLMAHLCGVGGLGVVGIEDDGDLKVTECLLLG